MISEHLRHSLFLFGVFTLFFRYLSENLLGDLNSLFIDIKLSLQADHRQLLSLSKGLILGSVFFILLKGLLYHLIIFCNLNPSSRLNFLFTGLNKRKIRLMMYFFHFLAFRIFVSALIFLDLYLPSKAVLMICLILQFFWTLMHLIKVYDTTLLYFSILVF